MIPNIYSYSQKNLCKILNINQENAHRAIGDVLDLEKVYYLTIKYGITKFNLNNETIVSFTLDRVGTKRFAKATTKNVGKRLAIILDNKIISAPLVREPIVGGNGQISGDFTFQSATDLALLLRSGALPAPLDIIEERPVGPDLVEVFIKAEPFLY